ncbi:MAG: response regulator transcription factor [Gammaproteobacteria bacterium]|jgi:two-component system response regulator RegA|nr:response regulator transcription factor [Gammaproteobacteria bacterium]MBT3725493.1 response regulator transcription factor [Gammaproteobacteria bacterium]MBT4076056.1 response regulator transcription factor [Gammaproteobacteria bacterium]MBT4195419.1 response regulator transcription factor [Gammaproteobacteria bacterium]MBT4450707.1 response regulator transcription factor [Gammaproteobacteria bacterium]
MSEENPKLLLVDDDEIFCQVLSKALHTREYSVDIAYNQNDAIQIAQQQHPEFAIVDLRIGNDSGLNVIKSLVESEPGIRIVVLTGYASISTAVESIKLGAIHYLTKPAEVEDILKAFYHDEGNADINLQTQPMSAKRMEWEHLQKVLHDNNGNISAAARAMGMHRRTLQRKLTKKPVKV